MWNRKLVLHIKHYTELCHALFLLFVILKIPVLKICMRLIAHFESFENIGIKEPNQIPFYLSIKHEVDLHYFEKYLNAGKNELTTT